jgi:PDZ domain
VHRRPSPLLIAALGLIVALGCSSAVVAATAPPPLDAAAANSLQEKIDRTLEARKWTEALGLIDRYLSEVRRDPVMLYNSACCHAQLGDADAGAKALLEAVKAGFRDFDTMEADPDLEPLREHATYTAILEARDRVKYEKSKKSDPPDLTPNEAQPKPADPSAKRNAELTLTGCPQCDEWKRLHGTKHYRYENDSARRLNYATCLDDETHKEMRDLIEREADWLAKNLFGDEPDYETLLAVPTPGDAKKYFQDPSTSGIYLHHTRMLVARDIGESLQHEFVHLMHYGHMERLRQKHPIWIQEGLATLFEAFELEGDGGIRFGPNTRHNVIHRAVQVKAAMPWTKLFALTPDAFMDRGSGLYPQVRSIFLYLADRAKLKPFYEEYTRNYAADPSGAKAIERIFGKPLSDVERQWRDWVKANGPIDDTIKAGDASLGIEITETPGGIKIKKTFRGSAVRSAGLRVGDVIVGIEGKAVRSSRELAVAIASRRVGDTILVRFRRGDDYEETPVTLRPLTPQTELERRQ